jgi:hypothetical protein
MDGGDGADGAPGEVSEQQLSDGLLTCSANTNGVATLDLTISDPPTQTELQTVVDKFNEILLAQRR